MRVFSLENVNDIIACELSYSKKTLWGHAPPPLKVKLGGTF